MLHEADGAEGVRMVIGEDALSVEVVATGSPIVVENRSSASDAPARAAPWPARTMGRAALSRTSAARRI
jgi:hypothetical protein